MASLEAQVAAVLLPTDFRLQACGQLCRELHPAPPGTLVVWYVKADGMRGDGTGPREVGVFGALRHDDRGWTVAVATADETWFHGDYSDVRVLRQLRGDPAEPLRSVLTAELIVLQ